MKNKLLIWGLMGFLILALQGTAFAAAKTLFIKGDNITSLGSLVTVGNDLVLFTKGGAPLSLYEPNSTTLITDFRIDSGKVYDKGSPTGRNVQIDCNVNDNLLATIWTPAVGLGNYYSMGINLSMSQANFDDSALTWDWTDKQVNYKAAAPYKPRISQFSEATDTYTDGRQPKSTLTVYSVQGSGSDGLREVNAYAWKMWEVVDKTDPSKGEPTTTLSGATRQNLSLDSDQIRTGVTYSFKVAHGNQWDEGSPTWSDVFAYTVAGGPTPDGAKYRTVIDLKKKSGDFGVNSFALPFPGPHYDAGGNLLTINTARALVDTINGIAGENVVTAFGFWDPTSQMIAGYVFKSDGTVEKRPASLADPENLGLVYGRGYQISLSKDVNFEIRNYIEGADQ